MSFPLRILVTGAGRGIGACISEKLLEQGHKVAICARTQSDLESIAKGHPDSSLVIVADVLADGISDHVISKVVAHWGGVDVLILNAGDGVSLPIDKTDDQVWDRMIDLNLTAPFRFMRSVIPVMKSQKSGSIIVIASKAGLVGAPNVAAYTAAKHGVVGLVRASAIELEKYGISVNAVCPDFVDTPMTTRSLEAAAERTGVTVAQARSALESKLSGARLLTPDEVADAAITLINSKGVTGQTQLIEGGK